MKDLAHWCLDKSKELVAWTLESAEELGIVRRCECCELYYKAAEVRYYGVTKLCEECKDNAEAREETEAEINKWLDKERR